MPRITTSMIDDLKVCTRRGPNGSGWVPIVTYHGELVWTGDVVRNRDTTTQWAPAARTIGRVLIGIVAHNRDLAGESQLASWKFRATGEPIVDWLHEQAALLLGLSSSCL